MRQVVVFLVALCFAACSAPVAPVISVSQLAQYRLASVEVDGEGVIRSWPAVEKAFLASGRGDPDLASRLDLEPASRFPALRAAIKQALETQISSALKNEGGGLFLGQRPIVAHVTVLRFDVPSAGRRFLAGGNGMITLKIDLIDPATREVLAAYPGQPATVFLTGGAIGVLAATMTTEDVGDELIRKAVALYIAWLRGRGLATF